MFRKFWEILGYNQTLPTNSDKKLEDKVSTLSKIETELEEYQNNYSQFKKTFIDYKTIISSSSPDLLPILESKSLQVTGGGSSLQAKKLNEKLDNILHKAKNDIAPLNQQLNELRQANKKLELCDVAVELAEKMDEVIVEVNEAILHSHDNKEMLDVVVKFILINLLHIPDFFSKDAEERNDAKLYLAIRKEIEESEKLFNNVRINLTKIDNYFKESIKPTPQAEAKAECKQEVPASKSSETNKKSSETNNEKPHSGIILKRSSPVSFASHPNIQWNNTKTKKDAESQTENHQDFTPAKATI